MKNETAVAQKGSIHKDFGKKISLKMKEN